MILTLESIILEHKSITSHSFLLSTGKPIPQGTENCLVITRIIFAPNGHKMTEKVKEGYPKGTALNFLILILNFKFMMVKLRAYTIHFTRHEASICPKDRSSIQQYLIRSGIYSIITSKKFLTDVLSTLLSAGFEMHLL